MKIKLFIIKGYEIKIMTHSDGKKALTSDSIPKLTELSIKYPDLSLDKNAVEMAKYLVGFY